MLLCGKWFHSFCSFFRCAFRQYYSCFVCFQHFILTCCVFTVVVCALCLRRFIAGNRIICFLPVDGRLSYEVYDFAFIYCYSCCITWCINYEVWFCFQLTRRLHRLPTARTVCVLSVARSLCSSRSSWFSNTIQPRLFFSLFFVSHRCAVSE